jgi:hypothetical protein
MCNNQCINSLTKRECFSANKLVFCIPTLDMTPIKCKRPALLLPKAIGETHVFNFFGKAGLLTAITGQGRLYLAYESAAGIELRDEDGHTMEKGSVHRFIQQHIQALKNGAVPASLTSVNACRRASS